MSVQKIAYRKYFFKTENRFFSHTSQPVSPLPSPPSFSPLTLPDSLHFHFHSEKNRPPRNNNHTRQNRTRQKALLFRLNKAVQQEEKSQQEPKESDPCSHCQESARAPSYTTITYMQRTSSDSNGLPIVSSVCEPLSDFVAVFLCSSSPLTPTVFPPPFPRKFPKFQGTDSRETSNLD